MQPLLIIGTQRSGSNLLRLMLNQVDEIIAPHPPHILQTYMPLLPQYGGLDKDANFEMLVNDVCDFVKANPVPWKVNDLNATQIISRCRHKTLINIYRAVYETYAEQEGARIWCCKSMANLYYIPQIENEQLKPIYLHLVRDGRDVAASFRKAIVGEKHIYHLAKQWKADQDTARQFCQELAPERYVLMLYENLIHDTENTMRILLHRLGLKFNDKVLHFYETEEARLTADAGKMWNNVRKPVMEKNSNKFLSQLSEEEILIFESIAGDSLKHYGYTPYFADEKRRTSFSEEEITSFNAANKKMKEEANRTFDPEGSEKRKAQEAIVKKVKERQPGPL